MEIHRFYLVITFFIGIPNCRTRVQSCSKDQHFCERLGLCTDSVEDCKMYTPVISCNIERGLLEECPAEERCVRHCRYLNENSWCEGSNHFYCEDVELCRELCIVDDAMTENCQNVDEGGLYCKIIGKCLKLCDLLSDECSDDMASCNRTAKTSNTTSMTAKLSSLMCSSGENITDLSWLYTSSCRTSSDCDFSSGQNLTCCSIITTHDFNISHCSDGQRFVRPTCQREHRKPKLCPLKMWACISEKEQCGKYCQLGSKYCSDDIIDDCVPLEYQCKVETSGGLASVAPLANANQQPLIDGFIIASISNVETVQQSSQMDYDTKYKIIGSNGVVGRWQKESFRERKRKSFWMRLQSGDEISPASKIRYIQNRHKSQYGTSVLMLQTGAVRYLLVQFVLPSASQRSMQITIKENNKFVKFVGDFNTEAQRYKKFVGMNKLFKVVYPITLTLFDGESLINQGIVEIKQPELFQVYRRKRQSDVSSSSKTFSLNAEDEINVYYTESMTDFNFYIYAKERLENTERNRNHNIKVMFERKPKDSSTSETNQAPSVSTKPSQELTSSVISVVKSSITIGSTDVQLLETLFPSTSTFLPTDADTIDDRNPITLKAGKAETTLNERIASTSTMEQSTESLGTITNQIQERSVDCNGDENGDARMECDVCIDGNTGRKTLKDCAHVCNGTNVIVDHGTHSTCEKNSRCDENTFANECGECVTEANRDKGMDRCGICNGTNDCIGCDDIPNSGKVKDECGACRDKNNENFNLCTNIIQLNPSFIDLAFKIQKRRFILKTLRLTDVSVWQCEITKFQSSNTVSKFSLMKNKGNTVAVFKLNSVSLGRHSLKCLNSLTSEQIQYSDLYIVNSRTINVTSTDLNTTLDNETKVKFFSGVFKLKNIEPICGFIQKHSSLIRRLKSEVDALKECLVCSFNRIKDPGIYFVWVLLMRKTFRILKRKGNAEEFSPFIRHTLMIKSVAPKAIFSILSDDLENFVVKFDSRIQGNNFSCSDDILIDQKNIESDCEARFKGTQLYVMVSGLSLSWLRPEVIITLLPSNGIVQNNADPTLVENLERTELELLSPEFPIMPGFQVNAPSVVCQSTVAINVIGVHGDGGSGLVYAWKMKGESDAIEIQQYLTEDKKTLNVPLETVQDGKYTVSVLGKNRANQWSTEVKTAIDIVKDRKFALSLNGPSEIYPHRRNTFVADIQVCDNDVNSEMMFLGYWNIRPLEKITENTLKHFETVKSNTLVIQSYELRGNTTYSISISAKDLKMEEFYNSTLTFIPISTDLVARIVPVFQEVQNTEKILLDGSASYDMGNELSSPMEYEWACHMEDVPGKDCTDLQTGESLESKYGTNMKQSKLMIPANTLKAGLAYRFSLTLKKRDREDTQSAILMVKSDKVERPKVKINMANEIIVVDGKAVVKGIVSSMTNFSYHFKIRNIDEKRHRIESKLVNVNNCPCKERQVSSMTTMKSGNYYGIELFVLSRVQNEYIQARDKLKVKTISSPHSGMMKVRPKTGIALVTNFNVSTSGWQDEAENLPLTFYYGYFVGSDSSGTREKIIVVVDYFGSLTTVPGIYLPEYVDGVSLFVEVCNTAYSCSLLETPVKVQTKQSFNETDVEEIIVKSNYRYVFKLESEMMYVGSVLRSYAITYSNMYQSSNSLQQLKDKIQNVYQESKQSIIVSETARDATITLLPVISAFNLTSLKQNIIEDILQVWNEIIENVNEPITMDFLDANVKFHKDKQQIISILETTEPDNFSELQETMKVLLRKSCQIVDKDYVIQSIRKRVSLFVKDVAFTEIMDNVNERRSGLSYIGINGFKEYYQLPNECKVKDYRHCLNLCLATYSISRSYISRFMGNETLVSDISSSLLLDPLKTKDIYDNWKKIRFVVMYDLKYMKGVGEEMVECLQWNSAQNPPFWDDSLCATVHLSESVKCICIRPGTVGVFNGTKKGSTFAIEKADEMYKIRMTFDADYNETVSGREEAFKQNFKLQMIIILGLDNDQITDVEVYPGSVIVEFHVQSSSKNPLSATEATERLKEMIQNGEIELKDLNNENLQISGLTSEKEVFSEPAEKPRDNLLIIISIVLAVAAVIIATVVIAAFVMKKKRRIEQKIEPDRTDSRIGLDDSQPPTYQSVEFEPVLGKYTSPIKNLTNKDVFMSKYRPAVSPPAPFNYVKPDKDHQIQHNKHVREFEENYNELDSSYHHDLFPVILEDDDFGDKRPYKESYM